MNKIARFSLLFSSKIQLNSVNIELKFRKIVVRQIERATSNSIVEIDYYYFLILNSSVAAANRAKIEKTRFQCYALLRNYIITYTRGWRLRGAGSIASIVFPT